MAAARLRRWPSARVARRLESACLQRRPDNNATDSASMAFRIPAQYGLHRCRRNSRQYPSAPANHLAAPDVPIPPQGETQWADSTLCEIAPARYHVGPEPRRTIALRSRDQEPGFAVNRSDVLRSPSGLADAHDAGITMPRIVVVTRAIGRARLRASSIEKASTLASEQLPFTNVEVILEVQRDGFFLQIVWVPDPQVVAIYVSALVSQS
jgi:hypothetical protein